LASNSKTTTKNHDKEQVATPNSEFEDEKSYTSNSVPHCPKHSCQLPSYFFFFLPIFGGEGRRSELSNIQPDGNIHHKLELENTNQLS